MRYPVGRNSGPQGPMTEELAGTKAWIEAKKLVRQASYDRQTKRRRALVQ